MDAKGFLTGLKMSLSRIKKLLEEKSGKTIQNVSSLSGGCISNAYKITLSDKKSFFLKMNDSVTNDMFVKEAHGLEELKKADAIRVPEVLEYDNSFLLLEFIEQGKQSNTFFEEFGRKFVELHRFSNNYFGFYEDNYIGSTVQKNIPSENEKNNWNHFYFNKRLLFQYKLAEKNGYATPELKEGILFLEKIFEKILSESEEPPSLLHGDLWGGNYITDENGNAAIFDPAVYYGHREADLAMTKLFGGFSSRFYDAYNESFPLSAGYKYRENIYKLYHVLNHLNLFGSSYYSQGISLINSYK